MALINVLVFTTRDCATCKPVLKQLDQIIRYVDPNRIAITKIDAKENPTLAAQFHVRQVPYVYYNDLLVLDPQTAAVLHDDESHAIFDVLFNKLLEVVTKQNDEHHEIAKKLSVIKITENLARTEGIMSGFAQIRPTIGDYVHVGVLQAITSSILLINPRSRKYMYEAGLLSGRYGSVQGWLRARYPSLDGREGYEQVIENLLKGINHYYGSQFEGGNFSCERILHELKSPTLLKLKALDSAFAARMPFLGEKLCYYLAGELAGIMEVILGTMVKVHEEKCWGTGHDHCSFVFELDAEQSEYMRIEENFEDKTAITDRLQVTTMERTDYRVKLEQVITHITRNKYLSVLYKQRMRQQAGDFVHISLLQKTLIGLKFSEPLNSALLFHAGTNFGRLLGDGGKLIHFVMERKGMRQTFPLDFKESVILLNYYLNSAAAQLDREHGDVDYELIDDESARVRMYECAIASGVDLQQMGKALQAVLGENETFAVPLCDFYAGMLKGRLELLSDEEIDVKEIACHATGSDYCEFEITID